MSKNATSSTLPPAFDHSDVHARVYQALEEFRKRDLDLLYLRTNERTLCHRFAVYLEPLFPSWTVDCEYNRNLNRPKTLDRDGLDKTIPDVIIHRRNRPENLCVFEVKKSTHTPSTISRARKLIELYVESVRTSYLPRYPNGAVIIFPIGDHDKLRCDWYHRGRGPRNVVGISTCTEYPWIDSKQ